MKRGFRDWARAGLLTIALLFFAGCGGSGGVSASLNSGGTGITNTFDSPSEMGVGDIMAIDFGESVDVTIDFAGVASGATFILAVGSSNSNGYGTSMQLSTDASLPEGDVVAKAMEGEGAGDDDGFGPQEILSAWLRASEDLLPESELPVSTEGGASLSKSADLKAPQVTEEFRVLSSLNSVSAYTTVTAEVRCTGEHVIFYVDTSPADLVSDAQVSTLCEEFDEVAAAEQVLLGSTSDVNHDGKLAILMTDQINRLGALGGGIITGYFYAGDLYTRTDSNPVSNGREIIYTMVPDPQGIYGTAVSDEFAMSNLLPAVLPHELQHAINYNQHVLVKGGQPEENWLNEGLSHLTEDVMGYGVENPSRYAMYLASPSTYGVVTQGSPNLMERGASYLFLRFLYEQASDGTAFLRGLEQTAERGVTNLERAFAGPSGFNQFSQFMARWTVALAMSDRGISQDPRYTYQERTRAATGNWEGVCLDCDADDNRGTTLAGVHLNQYYGYHNPSIDASTAMFFNVSTVPNQMHIEGTAGGGNYGILVRTQ